MADKLIGTTIGKYRVIKELGHGGMGVVYLAEHIELKKHYALKILPQELSANPEFIERFRREAQVMANLNHPHIVRVVYCDHEGDTYYLVMDYIAGPEGESLTLDDYLHNQGGKLPEDEVQHVVSQVCEAFQYAHNFEGETSDGQKYHGVVHRDLKPANILMDKNMNVKVADFGLARVLGDEYVKSQVERSVAQSINMGRQQSLANTETHIEGLQDASLASRGTELSDFRRTTTGALLGTYDFMSPEQKRGGAVDTRSDIYALGILIYQMLTGEKPQGAFRYPSEVDKKISPKWDVIIKKCLQARREDRFDSVDLITDLFKKRQKSTLAKTVVTVGSLLLVISLVLAYAYFHLKEKASLEITREEVSSDISNIKIQQEQPTTLTVKPDQTRGSLVGKVIDSVSRYEISGATVRVVNTNLVTSTSSDGCFILKNVPVNTTMTLEVSSAGYMTDSVSGIKANPGVTTTLSDILILPGFGGVAGRVSNASTSNGIGRATVRISGTTFSTITQKDGAYFFDTIPIMDNISIEASANGLIGKTKSGITMLPGITTTVDISLYRNTGIITGRISDASTSTGISGATIRVVGTAFSVRTDINGSYTISDVTILTSTTVEVFASNYQKGEIGNVEIKPGETTTVDLSLAPNVANISGVISNRATGIAISGASTRVSGTSYITDTGKNGLYIIKGIPVSMSPITVEVSANNYVVGRKKDVSLVAGKTIDINIQLLPITGNLTGQVIDSATHGGVEGAVVRVIGTLLSATTNYEGTWTISDVPVMDDGKVEAFIVGYTRGIKDGVDVEPGGITSLDIKISSDNNTIAGLGAGPTKTVDLGNGVKLDLVWIPPGEFMMGSPESEADRGSSEGPRHLVKITNGFWMGKHEVTQAQWQAVMGSNPSWFKDSDNPVENVSWNDCQNFLQKLSSRTGKTFRLPTEAEWEYACRAGTETAFHYGSSLSSTQANFDGNHPYCGASKGQYLRKTTSEGSYHPNAFGLYDMHGNVWEWCQDWYESGYYNNSPTSDPQGPSSGSGRVLRGGSWYNYAKYCRSALRHCAPVLRYGSTGFRVVLSASQD